MRNAQTPWIVGKIPLYEQPSVKVGTGHAGLYFDKFCHVFDSKESGSKAVWLKEFVAMVPRVGDANLIAEFVARRAKLIEQFHGAPVRMMAVDRFVTGLGYKHALGGGSDDAALRAVLSRGKAARDYLDPVPIPFLAVERGAHFLAGVLPRTPGDVGDAKRARQWLMEALEQLGAGAKTATGYGRFKVEKDATEAKKAEMKGAAPIKIEMEKPAEPTVLPAFFAVEFVNFGEAREARKAAKERAKKGKEAKFREFDLRPMDRTLTNLVGRLVGSSVDTEGYDLPFEAAEENAGVPKTFYVGNLEERDGKKIARLFSLTRPA